jgi:Transposase DDE domain
MSRHPQLYPWAQQIATHLPTLTPSLAFVLALWSVGMILGRRCGLDSVTTHLAALLGQSFNTVRQRLREFYQEAPAKRGSNRKDFQADACFAPLLAWVLSFWSEKRLALALDVTNLGSRFHVLCVSAVCGGVGIPVAWKILIGHRPDAWHPYWCELLPLLKEAVGPDWRVVVLSDRGLESPRLFREITALGWHPLMRVKGGGKFRPQGWHGWHWMVDFVRQPRARFAAAGMAYKGEPLGCTLLACWEEGHEEPWLLLTDLGPAAANPCWYAWRAWIEQGFKVVKSGGLNWHNTRMTQTERAERQFLAVAVTTLWLVAVGSEIERNAPVETIGRLPANNARRPDRVRRTRLFVSGAAAVLAALLNGALLPQGKLHQESWPEPWHPPTISEEEFLDGN